MSGCDCCESEEHDALLRRDWAVRVLDAWARLNDDDALCARFQNQMGNEYWECPDGHVLHTATNPDAARHAAALSVYSELPVDVRSELGECP